MIQLIQLTNYDLDWIVKKLPKAVRVLLMTYSNRAFVAGGFIRACVAKEEFSDIDLFFSNAEIASNAAYSLAVAEAKGAGSESKMLRTQNACTVPTEEGLVQFIHRWTFTTPESCLANFDFTIAKAAAFWNGIQWVGVCDERFYPDLAAKRLVYACAGEESGGSILRLLKFVRRGYHAPLDQVAKLLDGFYIKIQPKVSQQASREQVIHGLLKEVDPSLVRTGVEI